MKKSSKLIIYLLINILLSCLSYGSEINSQNENSFLNYEYVENKEEIIFQFLLKNQVLSELSKYTSLSEDNIDRSIPFRELYYQLKAKNEELVKDENSKLWRDDKKADEIKRNLSNLSKIKDAEEIMEKIEVNLNGFPAIILATKLEYKRKKILYELYRGLIGEQSDLSRLFYNRELEQYVRFINEYSEFFKKLEEQEMAAIFNIKIEDLKLDF